MFRSLVNPQGAMFFIAKVLLKTFTKFLYINRVLWQHVVLCKSAFPTTYCYTTRHAATTPC